MKKILILLAIAVVLITPSHSFAQTRIKAKVGDTIIIGSGPTTNFLPITSVRVHHVKHHHSVIIKAVPAPVTSVPVQPVHTVVIHDGYNNNLYQIFWIIVCSILATAILIGFGVWITNSTRNIATINNPGAAPVISPTFNNHGGYGGNGGSSNAINDRSKTRSYEKLRTHSSLLVIKESSEKIEPVMPVQPTVEEKNK